MVQELPPMTEEEHATWVRTQFQNANAHLAEHGLLSDRVLTKESRYLAPFVALWRFSIQGMQEQVWVITGDLPNDHIDASVAEKPREALRHFCYRWQLKADKLLANEAAVSQEDHALAQTFIKGAENVFPLTEMEELWVEES
ncbi:MAG: hypothetical protein HLUCCO02_02910 [Idiomarinaceae bacterium HL-53]|nr:MAG: hypothetical protein HLUCCO02_02910 [Idiomarinaceae bacterium HL-53]CUS48971.1 protein of unknown function (DUF4826) [Idiomarinaceae bacterium HL-53]